MLLRGMWKFSEAGKTRYGTRHEVNTPPMGFRGLGRASLQATCCQCYPASPALLLLLLPACAAGGSGLLNHCASLESCSSCFRQSRSAPAPDSAASNLSEGISLSLPLPRPFHLVRPEHKQDELLNEKSSCCK